MTLGSPDKGTTEQTRISTGIQDETGRYEVDVAAQIPAPDNDQPV